MSVYVSADKASHIVLKIRTASVSNIEAMVRYLLPHNL